LHGINPVKQCRIKQKADSIRQNGRIDTVFGKTGAGNPQGTQKNTGQGVKHKIKKKVGIRNSSINEHRGKKREGGKQKRAQGTELGIKLPKNNTSAVEISLQE